MKVYKGYKAEMIYKGYAPSDVRCWIRKLRKVIKSAQRKHGRLPSYAKLLKPYAGVLGALLSVFSARELAKKLGVRNVDCFTKAVRTITNCRSVRRGGHGTVKNYYVRRYLDGMLLEEALLKALKHCNNLIRKRVARARFVEITALHLGHNVGMSEDIVLFVYDRLSSAKFAVGIECKNWKQEIRGEKDFKRDVLSRFVSDTEVKVLFASKVSEPLKEKMKEKGIILYEIGEKLTVENKAKVMPKVFEHAFELLRQLYARLGVAVPDIAIEKCSNFVERLIEVDAVASFARIVKKVLGTITLECEKWIVKAVRLWWGKHAIANAIS